MRAEVGYLFPMALLDFLTDIAWVVLEFFGYKKKPTALSLVFIIIVTIGIICTAIYWISGLFGPVSYVK
jgi:hypothetical protein